MPVTEIQSATERIDRVEKRLRRQTRMFLAAAVLVIAASLAIAQAPARRVVEAEEFILRGSRGEELATLDSTGKGGAALALYDSGHHSRLVLSSNNEFSIVSLNDASGKGRIGLVSTDAEGPLVTLTGSDQSGVSMGVVRNTPAIHLEDSEARLRAELGISALRVYGSTTDIRATVGLLGDKPAITVSGPNLGGVAITTVPSTNTHSARGGIAVYDATGEAAWYYP